MTTGRPAPALMIQGTGSHVGKSLIVAGLARLFAREGLAVRPFKPQNMSNNAAVATQGGEIGRAQALQARAAGVAPTVDMNPVLLKPESERGAQVIVRGKRFATLAARDYASVRAGLLGPVLESFARLGADADLILVEGAGSPAETNLRDGDIANMGFAEAAGVPVVLVGDIDRGGVIASLVGTHAVLDAADRARVGGFIVNRFRGDPALFAGGMDDIARRTGWPSLGLVPHFPLAARLPAEDSVDIAGRLGGRGGADGSVKIAVPILGRIANFDDLDPLRLEPGVELVAVEPGNAIPGDAALVLIAGSKSTMADLALIRDEGWDIDIAAHRRRGGMVMGLCAGYQILGRTVRDPQGIEGPAGEVDGLALLDVQTELLPDKTTREVGALHVASATEVHGYEIHLGTTTGPDCARPLLDIAGRPDGASSADGRVTGTYVHGLFASDPFRRWFVGMLGGEADAGLAYEPMIDETLDALADHLAAHLDWRRLLEIAREPQNRIASTP